MDIAKLRAMRERKDHTSIIKEMEKTKNGGQKEADNRFWKLDRDKAGNGSAVIRLLQSTGEDLPWVREFTHAFKGPKGKWYIEKSLTTIGQEDPVSVLNKELWATGREEDKKTASAQKRKLSFISNILVVNDPKNPENNGKVFLWKYGKKIFDMITDKGNPTFEDDQPVNVFDYWEGANLKLRIKTVDNFPNYDASSFDASSPLFNGDDEKILAIANQQHDLGEFTDAKNFKSYDELQKKLDEVLKGGATKSAAQMADEDDVPVAKPKPAKSAPEPKAKSVDDDEPPFDTDSSTGDAEMDEFFKNLE